MTPASNEKNDTKLLLGVAGLVVAGAVAIALIAGINAEPDVQTVELDNPPQTAATPAKAPPVAAIADREPAGPMLASYSEAPIAVDPATDPSPVEKTPGSTIGPEVDEPQTFAVDPDADFVAGGMESFNAAAYDNAAAYFAEEVASRPGRAWSHYMLGLSLWKSGDAAAAAAALRRSAELDCDSIKTLVNLARIENDRGQFDAALQAAEQALVIDAEDPTALFLKGRSLRNLGRTDEAIMALDQSLWADPENAYVRNLRGLIALAGGEPESAVEQFTRAAEIRPEVAFIRNNLGMALEHAGRQDEAAEAYARAVELDGSHARAAANLARVTPLVAADETPVPEELATKDDEEPRGETIVSELFESPLDGADE